MGFDHVSNQIYISIVIQKWYIFCYISIWDQFKLFKMSDTVFCIYSVVLVTYIKLHDQNGDMENNSPHFYIEVTYYL